MDYHSLIHIIFVRNTDIKRFGDNLRSDLFPDIPTFFGNVLSSIILIFVILRYVYAPFRDSQRKKHDYIKKQISLANQKYSEALKSQQNADQYLIDARNQSNDILEQSKIEATNLRQKILDRAHAEQKKIYGDTKNQISVLETNSKNKIKTEAVNMAVEIASKILNEKIQKKSFDQTIDEFLDSVDSKHDSNK